MKAFELIDRLDRHLLMNNDKEAITASQDELRRLAVESESRRVLALEAMQENKRLAELNADLLNILERILRCHDSGNNGAYMGEAILCPMFAEIARKAIAKATGKS